MLQNTYTTRTDLSTEEVMYLVRVRDLLRSGRIPIEQFQMDTIGGHVDIGSDDPTCGTVGCIAGWMAALARVDIYKPHEPSTSEQVGDIAARCHLHREKFRPLFYPNDRIMNKATPADGATAITNFLDGKSRPWAFLYRK